VREILHYFFFQAEDGIRDGHVTGVQTCALPICAIGLPTTLERPMITASSPARSLRTDLARMAHPDGVQGASACAPDARRPTLVEIGRASCRERVEVWVGGG